MAVVITRERGGRLGYRDPEEAQGRGRCEDGDRDPVMSLQAKELQG